MTQNLKISMDYIATPNLILKCNRKYLLILSLSITAFVFLSISHAGQVLDRDRAAYQDDIRVLIDVSGSMKQNDPQNLRASALRLFISLLPSGVTSGVWMFDQKVQMIIPHQPVDSYWLEKARIATKKLHSKGEFTDIEATLEQATWDWRTPDLEARRSLILLTDGMVDISTDQKLNSQSRHRILNTLLPELQKSFVTIHTIALSGNADESLLEQLATTTGGWFEKAQSSEDLERMFLRMFDKVARSETVPIKDNQVFIDNSVNEATFLVFRKKDAPTVVLHDPQGVPITKDENLKNVSWYHESNYDLVTIRKPGTGKWKIDAQVDSDNRVTVVTNLKLKVAPIENNIASYEVLTLNLRIEENDNVVTNEQFLDLLVFDVDQTSQSGESWNWHFNGQAKPNRYMIAPGEFEIKISKSLIRGKHEFQLKVDGKTFQREYRQQINIYDNPVKVILEEKRNNIFEILLIPIKGLLDFDSLIVNGILVNQSGNKKSIEVTRNTMSEWAITLDLDKSPGKYNLSLHVQAKTATGKSFDRWMEPLFFGKFVSKENSNQQITTIENRDHTDQTIQNSDADWAWVSIYLVNLNIILIALGAYLFRLWQRWIRKSLTNPGLELHYDGV